MAAPTPGHPGFLAFASRCPRACGFLIAAAVMAAPLHVHAEAGEPFVVNEPQHAVPLPAVAADEGPTVGVLRAPRNPPEMESARGTVRHDALAQRPVRRASALVKAVPPNPPDASASPSAPRAERPTSVFVHGAAAAEANGTEPSSASAWRRLLASPYAVWIAAVILIGLPLLSAVRRHLSGRREERDLAEYD